MKKRWHLLEPKKKPDSPEELQKILLAIRGVKGKRERDLFLRPPSPDRVAPREAGIDPRQLAKAVARIRRAIEEKERILVYGDYDADGLCGTALIWETIYQLGGKITPYIPDRIKDGYGINQETVERIKHHLPDLSLVITVDNGIVAHKTVASLLDEGIATIVVDHHLLGEKMPPAAAIVHTTKLSGSGVAWFLARQLAAALPDLGLAALGTIADMLPVTGVNRSLIRYGIPYLEKTRRVGLRHLFRQAGIEGKAIDVHQVSFIIAPRINALGRIANPLDGLRLLCVRRLERGEELARLAQKINQERQKLTQAGLELARKKLGKKKTIPKLIFISHPSYHQGIVGLIAGKLMEEFYRPAVVVQEEAKISRGSARSIKGFDIAGALRELRELLLEVGGHPAAAGFKIETKKIPQFKKRLLEIAGRKLKRKKLIKEVKVDCELFSAQLNHRYWQVVNSLSPFGIDNWEPVFLIKGMRVTGIKTVGGNGLHLKLYLDDPQTPLRERITAEAIGFGLGEWEKKLLPGDLVDLLFNLTRDTWGGRERIVLRLRDLRISEKVVK